MRDRDVMERLAAADPLQQVELGADERREADELLARLLATPAPSEAPQRWWPAPTRRRLLIAAGAACAGAAIAVAALLSGGTSGGGGIVDKAVAAVTRDDVVYHVVQRTGGTSPGEPVRTVYREAWHTTDGRIHEKIFAARGTRRGPLLGEMAGRRRPGRTSGPALAYDPREDTISRIGFGRAPDAESVPDLDPFADPTAQLKRLQQRGELRAAGATRFAGRRAYRLVARSASWRDFDYEGIEFLVDAETYLPLAQRVSVRVNQKLAYRFFTRFLVYERSPLDARSRSLLALDPHPGATCRAGRASRKGGLGFPDPCRGSQ